MKKTLLSALACLAIVVVNAQFTALTESNSHFLNKETNMTIAPGQFTTPINQGQPVNSGSRAVTTIPVGTAGNLFTILSHENNNIAYNEVLNTVTFIHRNDQSIYPGTNVGQYRFDLSTNGGAAWNVDVKLLTPSPDNNILNGRFPQALIHNPAGNTDPDSAYLVYDGTWHDGNTWSGSLNGVARLDGDSASCTENIDTLNGTRVGVAVGMCNGAPGVFWNAYPWSISNFNGGNVADSGVILMKGTWNATTKTVDWVNSHKLYADYQINPSSSNSVAASMSMAFDASGTNGWIVRLGDIDPDNTANTGQVYDFHTWNTTDGGLTWNGPNNVDLDDIQGVVDNLAIFDLNGDPSSRIPTTAFECDVVVDMNGEPHVSVLVGNASNDPAGPYSIEPTRYTLYDFTYSASRPAGCEWLGFPISQVQTLRGEFGVDNPVQTMDNRPQASINTAGDKVFFAWADSDTALVTGNDNSVPDLFVAGIDLMNSKRTKAMNVTNSDATWGGQSLFPAISPNAIAGVGMHRIPTVLTVMDYNNPTAASNGNPAAFSYISDVIVMDSDFTEELDNTPPVLSLIGSDDTCILINTTWNDPGASVEIDCIDGDLTSSIQVVSTVDPSVEGDYTVTYTVEDSSGNTAMIERKVCVGAPPVCDVSFVVNPLQNNNGLVQFTENTASTTSYTCKWDFGDTKLSSVCDLTHEYTSSGVFTVTFTAENQFGKCDTTFDVSVTGVGINDVAFGNSISVYPNPASSSLNVLFSSNNANEVAVSIYNAMGVEVMNDVRVNSTSSDLISLDVSDLSKGVYLIKIESSSATAVRKITID